MDYKKFNSHCKYFVKVTSKSYTKITFTFSTDFLLKINGKLKKAECIGTGDNLEFSRGSTYYNFVVNDVDFYNLCT